MNIDLSAGIPFDIPLFLFATFAGSLVASMCGFAFGLVASAIWLHFISPAQSAPLIAAYAIVIQGWSVWRLRGKIRAGRVLPLLAGGMAGIPLGAVVLQSLPAWQIHMLVGGVCMAFGVHGLMRPALHPVRGGFLPDACVGFASGLLGSSTGLGGIPTTIWTSLRGWSKDEQRAVFQPVTLIIFVFTLGWFANEGVITADTLRLFFAGLPTVALGSWAGWRLYGRLDEDAFRKVLLVLLFVSGCVLTLNAG
jgi:uncharacterized membrane protein YfcA